MAYVSGNLQGLVNAPAGRILYRYDTADQLGVVEAANYFNNLTNNLNLQIGDLIFGFTWSATPFAAGSTITEGQQFVVTNVIANDAAAAAGAVDIAQVFIATGLLSSVA